MTCLVSKVHILSKIHGRIKDKINYEELALSLVIDVN